MQAAYTLQEVKMKYLLLGLVALVLTTFMFVLMSKAVYVELRERAGRENPGRRN
jgi:Na+-transporting methylmalonyl-CoA/oxaloacetate decarboxylase beta subunit